MSPAAPASTTDPRRTLADAARAAEWRTTRRTLLRSAAAAWLACAAPLRARAATPRLRWVAEVRLPHRLRFADTLVGGLSGLDFDPHTGRWLAISDDRSDLAPARAYELAMDVDDRGLSAPRLERVITLRQGDGSPWPSRAQGGEVPDPEAIRWRPGGGLLWANEGDGRLRVPPSVHLCDGQGRTLGRLRLPPHLHFEGSGDQGARDNLTLEGLCLAPDGRTVWVAMEAPLVQDGPVPAFGRPGGPCRIVQIDLGTGQPVAERAWLPDAVARPSHPPGAFADNGISEILALDGQRLLVLERSYVTGAGNSIRLYVTEIASGSDTLGQPKLVPGQWRPLRKTLVADFAALGAPHVDNLEGMCWGPPLAGGRRCLVLVSDDNFNPRQVTQFVACEWME